MAGNDWEAEAARRLVASVTPQIHQAMGAFQATQQASVQRLIKQAFAPAHQQWFKDMNEVVAPALKLDYQTLFPKVAAMQAPALKQLLPAVKLVRDSQRQQFAEIFATVRRTFEASLPPNWPRGGSTLIPSNLEELLLDEGLALAWVPPERTVERVFNADTAAKRRDIIGRHWKPIGIASQHEIGQIDTPHLAGHVVFAREAASTLLSGSHRASQALSANLLDTILRTEFDDASRIEITSQKRRLDIEEYPLRVAIVLAGVWGSYGQFWPTNGDTIPHRYSRHGSAHGVSRRQYSRVNAVIALMHIVSLLRLLDTDLRS